MRNLKRAIARKAMVEEGLETPQQETVRFNGFRN